MAHRDASVGSPVDGWRRYKRELSETEDRTAARWSVFRPKQVTHSDLLFPTHADRLKLLGTCLACGAGLSLLWIYFPMMMISIALDRDFGFWKWTVMGAFATLTGLALFGYGLIDEQKYWDSLD
jgi:hypothetical protein